MSKSLEDWAKDISERPKDPTENTESKGVFDFMFKYHPSQGTTTKKKAVRKKKKKKKKMAKVSGTWLGNAAQKQSAAKQPTSNVAPTSFECSACSAIMSSSFRDIFSSINDPVACSKCGRMCVPKYCNHFISNKWCSNDCYQKK